MANLSFYSQCNLRIFRKHERCRNNCFLTWILDSRPGNLNLGVFFSAEPDAEIQNTKSYIQSPKVRENAPYEITKKNPYMSLHVLISSLKAPMMPSGRGSWKALRRAPAQSLSGSTPLAAARCAATELMLDACNA